MPSLSLLLNLYCFLCGVPCTCPFISNLQIVYGLSHCFNKTSEMIAANIVVAEQWWMYIVQSLVSTFGVQGNTLEEEMYLMSVTSLLTYMLLLRRLFFFFLVKIQVV